MKNPVATLAVLAVGVAAIAPIAARAQAVLPNITHTGRVFDPNRLLDATPSDALGLWQRYHFTDTFNIEEIGFVNAWRDAANGGRGTIPQNRTIQVFRNGKNTGLTFTFAPVSLPLSSTEWVWLDTVNPLLPGRVFMVANAGDTIDFVFGDAPTDDDAFGLFFTGGPPLVSGVAGIQVDSLRGYRYTDVDGNIVGTDTSAQFTVAGWGAVNLKASAVPEPGEWAAMGVLGAGLAGLVLRARRRRA